jgi:MFS family permease
LTRTRRLDRASVALVLIAVAAGYGQFGAVASLGEVAHYFGAAAAHCGSVQDIAGLSGTVIGVGLVIIRLSSLLALPLAALADRWGRKKVLGRVAIVGLLATALAAGSPSYWAFVAFFAFARPLLSASMTLLGVLTVELSSTRQRVRRLAWIAAGAGGGAGVSAILHGVLPGANAFRILFATAALPALAVAPLLRRLKEPENFSSDSDEAHARLGTVPKPFRRQMLIVAILTAVVGVISGPANGYAFVYGENILHIARHEVAFVVALSALTGIGGLFAGRWFADRYGRRWTVAVGALATAATSLLAYSGGRTNFIAGYMCGVFAAAVLAPAASALTNEIFPHSFRATAAGWVVVAGVLGAIVGLLVFSLVFDATAASHVAAVHAVAQGTLRCAHQSATSVSALRIPAIVTFLPTLPLLLLLHRLPESRGAEIK